MWIGRFYYSVCHNSLFTCLFYYIFPFIHTGSLLFNSFLIVLAIDDLCRSGTFTSCISSVSCTPFHPSSYRLVCMHSCRPPFILSCTSIGYGPCPLQLLNKSFYLSLTAFLFPICEPLLPLYPLLSAAAVRYEAAHCRSLCQDLTCLAQSVVTDPGMEEAH